MSIHDALERTKLPIFIVVLIPLLGALYVFFGANLNSAGPSVAPAQQTSPQASAQTPLPNAAIALDNPSSLPESITKAELVPFSITVQNPSNQDATYQYKISVHWSNGESDVIDENTLSLVAGASQSIPEELKFEVATETAEVEFQLPQTGQSLRFALPRTQ